MQPFNVQPPERVWEDLTVEDIAKIAPLKQDTKLKNQTHPDLYNYIPSRFITIEEARYRGWRLYYIAEPCKHGHIAPRYVSNKSLCVDCDRAARGKHTIGGVAAGVPEIKKAAKARDEAYKLLRKQHELMKEPEREEKRFLEYYARFRSVEDAAKAIHSTVAAIESRRAVSKVFREACEALEERLGIKPLPTSGIFVWTPEKRTRLIEVWVDTGDIATARESIGVTPSEYFRELNRNKDFSAAIEEARSLAEQALEERAYQLALAGNDKLLQKILSAKKPEYRDRVQMDMNVTEKLDDRQLSTRLYRLFTKLRPVVDGTIIDAGEGSTPQIIDGVATEEGSSNDRQLLSRQGAQEEGIISQALGLLPSREDS